MSDSQDATSTEGVQATLSPADHTDDIQINILRGLPADRAAYYFLAIADVVEFSQDLTAFCRWRRLPAQREGASETGCHFQERDQRGLHP